jgi:hypothetical protein
MLSERELASVEQKLRAAATILAGQPGEACCEGLREAAAQLESMRRAARDEKPSAALIPSIHRVRQAAEQVQALLHNAAAFYTGLFSAPLPAAHDYLAGDYTADGGLNSANATGRVWLDA